MNCASKPRVISDDHNHNCNANVIESLGHLLALNPGIMFQIFSQFWRKKLQDKIWNEKRGFEARHLTHKWRTTITCYTQNKQKENSWVKPPKYPFMPNIIAFLSQLEKIYWNMQSKVLGQFEVKWFVSPKSKVLARNDRDAKQLKGQLTIAVTTHRKKFRL